MAKDPRVAASWYLKAARQGFAPAQSALGFLYQQGTGVRRNLDAARDWYLKAADQGDAYGQRNLGYMYRYGVGVARDLNQALGWYLLAAQAGDQVAAKAASELSALVDVEAAAAAVQANGELRRAAKP